jgi:hypothetical protein
VPPSAITAELTDDHLGRSISASSVSTPCRGEMSWSAASTGSYTWPPPPRPRHYRPLRLCLLSSSAPYGESWCKWTPPPYSPTSPLQLGPHPRSGDDREHPTNVSAAACRPTGHWATRAGFQCGLGRPDHLWPLKWSRPQVSPDRGCGPKNWPNTVPLLILFPDSFLN